MLRTKEALIPYLLLVAAIAGGLLWYESAHVPGLGQVVVTGKAAVGGPFHLVDQSGKPVSQANYSGRYMLIYFGYTFCPDVCPTTLGVMAEALDKLGIYRRRIVPLFITVDPARDTPKVMGQYVKAFGPDFIGLTGTPQQIAAAEKEYHVYAAKQPLPNGNYAMSHSSVIYLMGPDGKLMTFYDEVISPADLAKDLRRRI